MQSKVYLGALRLAACLVSSVLGIALHVLRGRLGLAANVIGCIPSLVGWTGRCSRVKILTKLQLCQARRS
jgi:hypothetical protein